MIDGEKTTALELYNTEKTQCDLLDKCADALALYDRLSTDYLFASNVAYQGPPTWDDEGIISTCAASKSWGEYGIYSATEWDFSGYCQIPTKANYDLLVT